MIRQTFTILILGLCGLIPGAAHPQSARECAVAFEEIITLSAPDFTDYQVWKETYGEKGMDQFADFIVRPDGSIIAAGSYTKDETGKTYRPLIVKFDPKGKTAWEVREDTKGFKSIDRMLPLADGFAVIGDVKDAKRRDAIYLAVYDDAGKKKKDIPIVEPGGDLDAKAIVAAPDQKGFIVAAQYVPVKDGEAGQYGVLYRYTSSGDQVWRRAYTPGMRTVFNNLQAMNDGYYALTGEVKFDDGRQAGWLMRMNGSGAIQWQRTYPRGSESSLFAAARFKNGDMILTGRTRPANGGLSAGWVMRVDTVGNTLWQRYFTSAFNMNARSVLPQENDGRSSVLLEARAQTLKQQTHTRLLTFSPRGYLANVEDYTESMGGRGLILHPGLNGERIVSGYAHTRLAAADDPDETEESVFDGWMFAAVSLDPYKDPCVPGGLDKK
jgi:hypothetical protein